MGVLQMNNSIFKHLKTLGPQVANLVVELHERGKPLFSHADVVGITGLAPKAARNFIASLIRSMVTRLKPGLFILVPFELGCERFKLPPSSRLRWDRRPRQGDYRDFNGHKTDVFGQDNNQRRGNEAHKRSLKIRIDNPIFR